MHRPRPLRAWLSRTRTTLVMTSLVATALVGAGTTGVAQSPGTDTPSPDRSFVGAWVMTDPTSMGGPPFTITVHADGALTSLQLDGPFSGAWEATGDDSAIVTMVSTRPDGVITIRADVTLAPDGETLSADYTLEPHCLCGDTLGQLGPGTVTGTRIHPEAPGEPVGPLQGPAPSPATPASPDGSPAA